MRTSPHTIDSLFYWQARLMFFDPLVDMNPAIKVFRYNTIKDDSMNLYQEKLQNIVERLMSDYLKTAQRFSSEPLLKLYQYVGTARAFS